MFIKLYCMALPVFVALDFLWVGLLAKNFYQREIGYLMKSNVNWVAVALFYLVFVSGLVLFVITPAVGASSLQRAVVWGALFGFVAYATYDFTNLATVKDWPWAVTVVDLIWGALVSSVTSAIAFVIASKLGL